MTTCNRIFAVTEDREFKTIEEFQKWLLEKCKIDRKGKFHLRSTNSLGNECNSPGSLWIFRFKGHLIGEGIVEKDIGNNDDKEEERYAIYFQRDTLKLYSKPIPVKNISLPSGKDITSRGIVLSKEDYLYLKSVLLKYK